ncbi:MAG: hypothetical protein UH103_01340, partial [Paludibacteraceae bacterium]|nr:hypothetical protein [Paludibacteraceae bacterium]
MNINLKTTLFYLFICTIFCNCSTFTGEQIEKTFDIDNYYTELQIEDAIKFIEERIKRNIGKEGNGRNIDINRWKNTLEKLSSVIKDEKGVTSIELTKDDSRVLAELSKKGLI